MPTDPAAVELVPFDADRDAAELFALFARIVEAGEGYPHHAPLTRADHDALWRSPVATVTVARLDGHLVGAYYLKPNYAGRAGHIANAGYVVDASARGLGLGRRLVQHSIEAAPSLGFDAIVFNLVFESNPARPMYEELGWQQVGRIPDAVDGEAGIVYWRRVGAARDLDFERFLGGDWSGAKTGGNVFLAEVVPGPADRLRVVRVERSSRDRVEAELRERPDRRTLAGLDFSFSFPEAFALADRDHWSWSDIRGWAAALVAAHDGDVRAALHAAPERPQFRLVRGDRAERLMRRTELACSPRPQSVCDLVQFQRQVGLGTIHGMAVLDRLAGLPHLAIWPFDRERVGDAPLVIAEVYPAMWLDTELRKGSDADRREQVRRWRAHVDGIDDAMAERLERSPDAADALAVALALPDVPLNAPDDDVVAREGWILGVTSDEDPNSRQ